MQTTVRSHVPKFLKTQCSMGDLSSLNRMESEYKPWGLSNNVCNGTRSWESRLAGSLIHYDATSRFDGLDYSACELCRFEQLSQFQIFQDLSK